jgi:hypothetical protein
MRRYACYLARRTDYPRGHSATILALGLAYVAIFAFQLLVPVRSDVSALLLLAAVLVGLVVSRVPHPRAAQTLRQTAR